MDAATRRSPESRGSGRRLGPRGWGASVIALAAASWLAGPSLQRWHAERRARLAFEDLAGCLGLGAGVTPDALRRRAIAAELDGADWPRGCQRPSTELVSATGLARKLRADCEGSCCLEDATCLHLTRAHELGGHLHDALRGVFDPVVATRLWDAATELGWRVDGAVVPLPPVRGTSAAVPPLSRPPLHRSALVRTADARWWLMIHHGRPGALLCELVPPEGRAACEPLPPAVSTRGDLFLIDGGLGDEPSLLAADDAGWGVFTGEGALRLSAGEGHRASPELALGATTLPSGAAAALVSRADGEYAVQFEARDELALVATSTPLLFAGHVIFQREAALLAQPLAGGDPSSLATVAPALATTLRPCITSRGVALRVRQEAGGVDTLALLSDGAWVAHTLPPGIPANTLSCHGARAHLTWLEAVESGALGAHAVRGSHRVHDVICTAAGCDAQESSLVLERHAAHSRFFVASLGEKVAVIWRSPLGDVRARVGPLAALAEQPAVPVFDDAEHGGFAWDEANLRLLSVESDVLLLVEHRAPPTTGGQDGVYAILLGADGRVTPVTTAPRSSPPR